MRSHGLLCIQFILTFPNLVCSIVNLLCSGFSSWPCGPAIPESKSEWGKVSVEDFDPSLAVCAADLGLCACLCVYLWAPFQTNKPEFCADFPDKLFLLVAQDVSQLPQWASDSIPGEVQLGWKQRQQYTFFFGFLITSLSVFEAFFLKKTSLCRCCLTDFLSS